MKKLRFLIYLYLLLRPYYIFESGFLQICDIFFILAFAIFMLTFKDNNNLLKKQINDNKEYFLFLIIVIFINSIYFCLYTSTAYIAYTLYYIFNFAIILVFSLLLNDKIFIKNMDKIMKFNLIVQLILFIFGFGSWYGTYRYMGTFNDPNQFAYYILINYCYIYLFGIKFKNNTLLYLFISFFLILESASAGILIGIAVFLIAELFNIILGLPSFIKKNKRSILKFGSIVLTVVAFYLLLTTFLPNVNSFISNKMANIKMIDRVEEKIEKKDSKNGNLLQERGYDRIYYYPQYIIFGAGEGNFKRWNLAYHQQEFHATLPNILFNYGVISLLLVVSWMHKKIRKLPLNIKIVYIALLCESFTLVNSRQALFWIIFILGNKMFLEEVKGEKNEKEKN